MMNAARILSMILLLGFVTPLVSQEADVEQPLWIWAQQQAQGRVPQGSCYFRKVVELPSKCGGRIEIAADDDYEVYLNGKSIGTGSSWEELKTFQFGKLPRKGRNTLAVKVTNRNGSTAGLAARVWFDFDDANSRVYITNPTWKASEKVFPLWYSPRYGDRRWKAARSVGRYGKTEPWITKLNAPVSEPATVVPELLAKQEAAPTTLPSPTENAPKLPKEDPPPVNEQVAVKDTKPAPAPSSEKTTRRTAPVPNATEEETKMVDLPRFRAPAGFRIEHVIGDDDSGSLISMAFNEFGEILAGREQGPLLMFYDTNENGTPDASRVVCDKIENCQGILAISGRVFVVADGPGGAGLYRLDDPDRDGVFERVTSLVKFEDEMGEHGPHGLVLGPDGMIYIAIGNHTKLKTPLEDSSPYRHVYEPDLVKPRYEDPRGHAAGVRSPGGGILRVDQKGERLELIAGGLRNAYDLAFDRHGELFVHDSDMESDEGTPWHRPTRLLHVTEGADFGWRSGWGKWPDHYVDTLPAVLKTGRGSPSGMVPYNHLIYPERFHGTLFSCDWATGQIHSIRLRRQGASYVAKSDVFLEGKPLNVTDIDVGPDGSLYFCTGGRGTKGNVFRVVWTKESPARKPTRKNSVEELLQSPQIDTAWGRQRASLVRARLGKKWDNESLAIVLDNEESAWLRVKTLNLMHLLGPPPSDELLTKLSSDKGLSVRFKAAELLGLIDSDLSIRTLKSLLKDSHPAVRRAACESLVRVGYQASWQELIPLMSSNERHESYAARRLLESNVSTSWHDQVFATNDVKLFVQGATALMISNPSSSRARRVLQRATEISSKFVPDADFMGMLRVVQLTVARGKLPLREKQQKLNWLVDEFPVGNIYLNRELIRILGHLQYRQLQHQFADYLQANIPDTEKVFLAMHLPMIKGGWTPEQRLQIMRFFDEASAWEGGDNLNSYLRQGSRRFAQLLTPGERLDILAEARSMPNAALDILFAMPEKVDAETVDYLAEVYRQIDKIEGESYAELKTGMIAVMASSGQTKAMAYLREIYDRDPERREKVAFGLAQQPGGRNWDYLVRSLPLLEGETAKEVLQKLKTVAYAPEKTEHFRQVIICGLRLGDEGGQDAVDLLQHWVGVKPAGRTDTTSESLVSWQNWFAKTYPNEPLAAVPQESGESRWTLEDLDTYLTSREGREGSSVKGAVLFRNAQCASCHKFAQIGRQFGPDLTNLASRMHRREVLESVIHPSQVISDQYASHVINLSDGRTITGLMMPQEGGEIAIMSNDGRISTVAESDVESFTESPSSTMPKGLLNSMSLEDVADLFAFLMNAPEPNVARRNATSRN